MPVYNGENYLRNAIESILGQKFTDLELLIINDGSTDTSVAIIQSFRDSRIRLVHNVTNEGLVASLNRGLTLARGEYIARMDQDDISMPVRLTKQVRFMDNNPHIGVCGSWVRYISKANHNVWKLPERSEEIRCYLFNAVGVAHPSIILRRQLFIELGLFYNPDFQYIEDYELWGRAIQHMEFANIQEVLLNYRISPGQICATYGSEQLKKVAFLRLQRVRELGIDPTQEEQQLHEMIMNNAMLPESESLDRAERWLLQLESANRAAGTYPADIFSQRLLAIWFSICISLADASVCSSKRCLLAPLWNTASASSWQRLRALGSWVVRRGVWETIRGLRHV